MIESVIVFNSRISIFILGIDVHVDRILDTVVAGGAEILGLHATLAPHRQQTQSAPTKESYEFCSYSHHVQETCCTDYARVMERYIHQSVKQLLHNGVSSSLYNRELLENITAQSCKPVSSEELNTCIADDSNALLILLVKIFTTKHDAMFFKNVSNIVSDYQIIILKDRLLNCLLQPATLKPCLDTVVENSTSVRIKICEVGAPGCFIFETVLSQLSTQPQLKVDYTLLGSDMGQLDTEKLDQHHIQIVSWNIQTDSLPKLGQFDLVIFNYSLQRSTDIKQTINQCKDLLGSTGFLLIHEPTQSFSIPLITAGIAQALPRYPGRTCGPYCDEETWQLMLYNAGYETVSLVTSTLSSMFLCRMSRASVPANQTLVSVEGCDFSWVEHLKSLMQEADDKPNGHNIWLISTSSDSYHNGVIGMINCLRREPGGDKLR